MAQDIKQMRVKIFDELSKIVDPEIDMSIVELELIDEVEIEDSDVKVDLHLTSPFCPAVFGFKICQDIHDNLLMVDGVDDVKVNVSNHFMAEQINNQVNNSPNPKKTGAGTKDADATASQQQQQSQPPPQQTSTFSTLSSVTDMTAQQSDAPGGSDSAVGVKKAEKEERKTAG